MPFINTKTNLPLSPRQMDAVKTRLGQAVSCLGKSENYLMVGFEPETPLYFKGDGGGPFAFVEVKLYGDARPEAYEKMTGEVTAIMLEALGIDPCNCYVQYTPCAHWGWNGHNF